MRQHPRSPDRHPDDGQPERRRSPRVPIPIEIEQRKDAKGEYEKAEVNLSAVPRWLTNFAQLLLGCALGARFERSFLRRAPRFVAAVVVSIGAAMALSAVFGVAVAAAAGLHPATLVLATAPGGIAEMSITAKVLELGVPLVTAFHVTRVVLLLTCTAPLFAWLRRRRRRAR